VSESPSWLPWIGWGFPVFFVALWVGIFQVVARWGGWRTLAESYPDRGFGDGERFRMRSAAFRAGCNYNNCITFTASPMGLRLSLPFPFGFGHHPIFLPWGEARVRETTMWRVPVVEITTLRHPDLPIRLQRRFAEKLLAAAGSGVIDVERT
jgi:hypothetical protein